METDSFYQFLFFAFWLAIILEFVIVMILGNIKEKRVNKEHSKANTNQVYGNKILQGQENYKRACN